MSKSNAQVVTETKTETPAIETPATPATPDIGAIRKQAVLRVAGRRGTKVGKALTAALAAWVTETHKDQEKGVRKIEDARKRADAAEFAVQRTFERVMASMAEIRDSIIAEWDAISEDVRILNSGQNADKRTTFRDHLCNAFGVNPTSKTDLAAFCNATVAEYVANAAKTPANAE